MSERIDETGFGEIRILQNPEAFCYGADAVILAGFAEECFRGRKKKPMRLLDLGTGTGILPLILAHKTEIPELAGIEMQESSFRLAERNIALNGLEGRLTFYHGDIGDRKNPQWESLREHFDVVVSNPPYTEQAKGISSDADAKHIARHETTADLKDFLRFAFDVLKDRGELLMVNRPARTADICAYGRETGMEVKELRFVSGHLGEAPNLVLARMVKNARRGLRVLEPMYIREQDGRMSEEMLRIHERGKYEGGNR